MAARSWKVSRRRVGPPTPRACPRIACASRPSAVALAITSPVVASRSAIPPPVPAAHRPATKLCSCMILLPAHDLAVNAVGASAKQRDPLAPLVGNVDLVDAVTPAAPQLARLGGEQGG